MNLKSLLDGLPLDKVEGTLQRSLSGIVTDSRRVTPDALFFALPGKRTDGSYYIQEAIQRGAAAIITEQPIRAHPKTTMIRVEDSRGALAVISKRFFGAPDERLALCGITGTNGKTTVSTLLHHFLGERGSTGLIGTIRYVVGNRTFPSFRTTPEVVDAHSMFASMVDQGVGEAVMEVSSHGIDQRRVEGIHYDTVAFLNLTQDHLDYHQTMEEYFAVKARLFNGGTGPLPRCAVVNVGDSWGKRLREMIPDAVEVITFSLEGNADYSVRDLKLESDGARFELVSPAGVCRVHSHLLGRYNVENLLAALAMGSSRGLGLETMLSSLAKFGGVPGRMERVPHDGNFNVVVDYAHTDDALRNALTMLRTITPGKICLVFGCGGDRDRGKRTLMAGVAEEMADAIWITADNPRNEDLEQIFGDMRTGLRAEDSVTWVADRRRAISLAMDACGSGDCLLIAGKGHETFQEFAGTVTPFDDRQVARELLKVKGYLT